MRCALITATACALSVAGWAGPTDAQAQAPAVLTAQVPIEMSDGTIVRATLYRPAAATRAGEPMPAIVEMTPYSGAQGFASAPAHLIAAARRGYAAMLVDIRGTGVSAGDFCFLCRREIQDGHEVVEWVARQPWSDGQVGMFGYSYPGIVAALVAATQPPHLRAIVAGAAYNDAYRDVIFPGGILSADAAGLGGLFSAIPYSRVNARAAPLQSAPLLLDALGRDSLLAADVLRNATDGPYWHERAVATGAGRITVPSLHLTGWADIYPRGTPLNFQQVGSEEKALVVGPWGHLAAGQAAEVRSRAALRWFDVHMRTPAGALRSLALGAMPRVVLFDQDPAGPPTGGVDVWRGAWKGFEHWPPAHRDEVLHLCAGGAPPGGPWRFGGSLRRAPCAGGATAPVPAAPLDLTGGTSILHDAGEPALHEALDQRLNAAATAFAGEPLDEPAVLTGPIAVRFTARTAGTDADWIVRVVDIGPGGAKQIARGWLKASHRREDPAGPGLRHTHTAPQRLVPLHPYRLGVEVWPTAYRVAAGHRIAVLLSAADTMKVLPSGESAGGEVLTGPSAPATVTLPFRTEAGRRVADPLEVYDATPLPPTDAEPCRPAIGDVHAVAGERAVRLAFRRSDRVRGPVVAEILRVAGARTVLPGDRVARVADQDGSLRWDGRGPDGAPAPDGTYVARVIAGTAAGVTVRNLALRKRGAALAAGRRFERAPTCGVLRRFRLSGPVFGGSTDGPLDIRYTLGRRARVAVAVLRRGRVVRRFSERSRAARSHRLRLPARGLRRGRYDVRLTARRRGRVVSRTLSAERL